MFLKPTNDSEWFGLFSMPCLDRFVKYISNHQKNPSADPVVWSLRVRILKFHGRKKKNDIHSKKKTNEWFPLKTDHVF